MSDICTIVRGSLPLLISIPHDGRMLAPGQAERMTAAGRKLPDTDWDVGKLYDFAPAMGANVVAARYSRYVVDLNRPANDAALYAGQVSTGLCPERTFSGDHIYRDGAGLGPGEQDERVAQYWRPYHDAIRCTLDKLIAAHGYALLWDAHSIASEVPALFDGILPGLNFGTNDGASCAPQLSDAVTAVAAQVDDSVVLNGRFRGGYITRHYGDPANHVHAIQLELSQRTYMDEKEMRYDLARAARLADMLKQALAAFVAAARRL